MNSATARLQKSSIVWILVANGEQSQVYRYHRDNHVMPMHASARHPQLEHKMRHELEALSGMKLMAEPLSDFQVGHDRRGSFIGGKSAHNTCEPHLDIRDEVKQDLVVKVVAQLKQACRAEAFDHLVIAASPKILGALRKELSPEVMLRVISEIPKDFTHDTSHALLAHLQASLTEAHVN